MNNFDREFERMQKRGNWLFTIVPIFIGVVFCMIVAWYVFIGYVAVKTVDQVDKHGLKSVVERVWEGPKDADSKNIQR